MGAVGTCADNAAMESFFNLAQTNVLDRKNGPPDNRQQLRLALVPLDQRDLQAAP